MKTNIEGQLDFVRARHKRDARFRPTVRILKGWKRVQELNISSFAIELLVSHLLDERGPAASLEDSVIRLFLYIAQSELKEKIGFAENGTVRSWPNDPVVILDPVNAENNITRRLIEVERAEVVAKAHQAWECLSTARRREPKGETVELWRQVFGRSFRIE